MNMLIKKKNEVATDVLSKDVSALPVNTDSTVHTRIGWIVIIFGVVGFMLWALFAPLDQGVPIQGNVEVSSSRKAIQHQTGGTVEDILVKEGEVVKAGQPLVKMNAVQANAAAEITRIQYFTARAAEARLVAERDGKSTITYPEDLLKAKSDPRIALIISVQDQLFSSRRFALQNELAAVDENVSGLQMQIKGLEESREMQKQQVEILKEQLGGLRDLAKEGFVPRNRLLDLERTYAGVTGGLSENIGNIGRAQRQVSEMKLRRMQRLQEYQKEVRAQLVDMQREAEGQENRLKSLDYDLKNVIVRAPVDGVIVGVNIATKGGVVGPGAKLMDMIPSEDALVVEAMAPTHLIDKLHVGLKTEMIFPAFNQNKTPHIPGEVTHVSADRFVDEKSGMPYYKVKAKVAPEGMKLIKDLQIRPGMPVELFVKTGERTMMNYLLKPIFDRAKTSLTEE